MGDLIGKGGLYNVDVFYWDKAWNFKTLLLTENVNSSTKLEGFILVTWKEKINQV